MTTVINSYSVGLSLNPQGVVNGAKLARGEINSLNKILRDSKPDAQRMAEGVNIVSRALAQGQIDFAQFTRSLEHLKNKYKETAATLSGSAGGQNAFAAIGGRFTAAFGVGFLAKETLKLASEAETAQVSFEVLTDSAATATAMVSQMRKLDAESPLDFTAIQQAGKTLLGYGLAAEQVMPSLKSLGEISMGNNEKFKLLALAYGQTQAAGKLMAQEVLQMINHGFNPLREISEMTGKSMATLRHEMSEGLISSEMVTQSLRHATDEGGRFHGLNERLVETAAGGYAKMLSNLKLIAIEYGEHLLPAAKEFMRLVQGPAEGGPEGFVEFSVRQLGLGLGAIAAATPALMFNDNQPFLDYIDRLQRAELMQAAMSSEIEDTSIALKKQQEALEAQKLAEELQKQIDLATELNKLIDSVNEKAINKFISEFDRKKAELEAILNNPILADTDRKRGQQALDLLKTMEFIRQQEERLKKKEELTRDAERFLSERDPLGSAMEEMRKLREQWMAGILSDSELADRQRIIAREAAADSKREPKINNAIEANTQEAARFLAEQRRDRRSEELKILTEQKTLDELKLKELEEIKKQILERPLVGRL